MIKRAKISGDYTNSRRKNKYYKDHSEGYGHCNDFVLSDDIRDWSMGKTRRFKAQSKPLF